MKEWSDYSTEDLKRNLKDFARRIKNSDHRKRKLIEALEYVIHQMYSVSGPVYDRVGGSTNVKPDRIMILLDKKDRIEKALVRLEEEKNIYKNFVNSLTEKQRKVFDYFFVQDEKITRISRYLGITYQAVEQQICAIFRKWSEKKSFF